MSATSNSDSATNNAKYFNGGGDGQTRKNVNNKPNHHKNNNNNNKNSNANNYKNNANNNTNNVAPLRQQNFNSVTNEQVNSNNQPPKFNGKKHNNKRRGNNHKNSNNNIETIENMEVVKTQETIQSNETASASAAERLTKRSNSLNIDEVLSSGVQTSVSLENIIDYYNNESTEKRSSFEMATVTATATNNLIIEETIIEQENEVKQTQLNESETSLEFASCCSTPMSQNDSRILASNANKENFSIEKVIASLNFKTNNVLGLDMEQFNASSEENEVTCIEVYNNLSNKDRDEEDAQISVVEAKTPIEASTNFDYQKETESVITTVTSDSFQWYHKPDFPSLHLDEAKTPVEFNADDDGKQIEEDQFEINKVEVQTPVEHFTVVGLEAVVDSNEDKMLQVDRIQTIETISTELNTETGEHSDQFENDNIQSYFSNVENYKVEEVHITSENLITTTTTNNEIKTSVEVVELDSNESYRWNQAQIDTVNGEQAKTPVNVSETMDSYEWYQKQVTTEVTTEIIEVNQVDFVTVDFKSSNETNSHQTEVIHTNIIENHLLTSNLNSDIPVQKELETVPDYEEESIQKELEPIQNEIVPVQNELEPVQKELETVQREEPVPDYEEEPADKESELIQNDLNDDKVIIIDHRLKESDTNKEIPQKEITNYITNIISDVISETEQRTTTNQIESETNKHMDDHYSSFNTLDEVTNNFVVINTPDLKEIMNEIKLEEELKTNDLSMSNIVENIVNSTEGSTAAVAVAPLVEEEEASETENETKLADKTAKSSKVKQDKKSKEPPVDCFGCSIL